MKKEGPPNGGTGTEISEGPRLKEKGVLLTSLSHVSSQDAGPFQRGYGGVEMVVLVDIDRSAQLANLPVQAEDRAVTRRRGGTHQLHQRPYNLPGHGVLEARN